MKMLLQCTSYSEQALKVLRHAHPLRACTAAVCHKSMP